MIIYVCVLYGNADHIFKLFSSLNSQELVSPIDFYVVDNNVDPSESEKIKDFKFDSKINFQILRPQNNLGYFGAAQWALEKINAKPDWVLVSNSDLSFADSSFFKNLASYTPHDDLGALAPQIMSELSQIDQNPYLKVRPTVKKMQRLKWIFNCSALSYAYQSLSHFKKVLLCPAKISSQPKQEIYAPHGSFFIFSKNYFSKGASLDHPPFLFGEEITVAEKLRSLKLKAIYDPIFKVTHSEHQATGRIPDRRMRNYIAEASRYCADTYFKS